ncbi:MULTISPECIES: HNH endonuclease signature motif containing protein [unclassified Rathayibacter]|uniref:HNH endonuclease signature motif containing protein n=1 Tax=unclassified Rathayibacter TaxID=2609250 RepID=UPI0007003910|nr:MULTISPECIES: HNH endonuclease signature motif containing protein [unclassified Rathayibacter]KQQ05929.1 hypothetical protein ASF42_05160 [Rathayibacter sp. Leaf294]KQS13786.1 hypothetical protein ASG06_05170 [Rathayibacter sp. Leaf185]
MAVAADERPAEASLDAIREGADDVGRLARNASRDLLAAAERLYEVYRAALSIPLAFARGGLSSSESHDLVERSIRAELAVGSGVSERELSRELERAHLLVEDLPSTRAALAAARIRWRAAEVICSVAALLPKESLPEFDERAAELALSTTPTQLRRAVDRLRDELHDEPLEKRHAHAMEDRGVWLTPEIDGMATLSAYLPAPVAVGVYNRLDRIARALRDGDGTDGDERTLAQLRADALTDLLCDGDIAGTTPVSDGTEAPPTFVPGIRADVRLTLAASTAAGLDDALADLDGFGAIPAAVARELVGVAATFTRVLTDRDTGTVTSVGRTHRVPPPQMRLHLQLRDQTCRFPGCTRPASTTEADHTIEWRNGGDTSLHNLASLCTAHHHVRHGDRWTYRLHPDGTADWTTPTCRHVTARPPALPGRPPAPPPRFDDATPSFGAPRKGPRSGSSSA